MLGSEPTSSECDSLLSLTRGKSDLKDRKWRQNIAKWITEIPYIVPWRVYLQQGVLPGIALALLIFTLLRSTKNGYQRDQILAFFINLEGGFLSFKVKRSNGSRFWIYPLPLLLAFGINSAGIFNNKMLCWNIQQYAAF